MRPFRHCYTIFLLENISLQLSLSRSARRQLIGGKPRDVERAMETSLARLQLLGSQAGKRRVKDRIPKGEDSKGGFIHERWDETASLQMRIVEILDALEVHERKLAHEEA